MNQRLTDVGIRRTYQALKQQQGRVSGRQLCMELRRRFGAVGKTERVFAIWREEVAASVPPPTPPVAPDVLDLQRRVELAEQTAAEAQARADIAVLREQSHQNMWLMEIDRLRQELKSRGAAPRMFATVRRDLIIGDTGRVHRHQFEDGKGLIEVEFADLDTRDALMTALRAVLTPPVSL